MNLRKISEFMENQIPFNKHLGMKVQSLTPGKCAMILPFQENFIGDPVRKALHGGVISSLIDTTGGLCCWSMLKSDQDRISTVDIRIDYLQKGPTTDLICHAKVLRMGNRVAVARMDVFKCDDQTVLIATGQGVYNVSTLKQQKSVTSNGTSST